MEVLAEGPVEGVTADSEGLLTEDELRDIQEDLSHIEVTEGERAQEPDVVWDVGCFPSSYSTNSPKEEILLQLADNFQRQYSHLYPDRKALFMCPTNECGLEKCVVSSLHPTLLPHPELYDWKDCATFVSEFLSLETLNPPTQPPPSLFSSSSVLQRQKGNCFDFSSLLCSLLLGAGYDAFCVSGYASREMCLQDESREVCPLLTHATERDGEPPTKPQKKYSVKPPRQLLSRFQLQQEAKHQAKIQAVRLKEREDEEQRQADAEKSPPDPLFGRRVHCWLLVLSGKREVPENFFIDALTGKSYPTKDEHFLGIESVWNHQNYWVNMQDCRHGCKDMTFDLGDPVCWEFMLVGDSKPLLLIPDMEEGEIDEEESEDQDPDRRTTFQMPPSWTLPIVITPKEFGMRSPQGKKLVQYKRSKLEKWAPYLREDGKVARLAVYQDAECSLESEVQEWFKNRKDKLEMKQQKKPSGETTEYFSPGRSDALKVHVSEASGSGHSMLFHREGRLDGLEGRDERAQEMRETFQGRPDFLRCRIAVFGKRAKKVAIAGGPTEANPRPILKITERFYRNPEKAANEDVAERTFLITEDRINVRYHRQDDHITTSYWEFQKAGNLGEKGTHTVLSPETCISYQVEPSERYNKQLYVYETLLHLQQGELSAKEAVRKAEAEVLEILSVRAQEESDPQLMISIYDPERNEKSKAQREALERAVWEEGRRSAMLELDYLAPFLARLGDPQRPSRAQSQQLKEECLTDMKQRLINKANLIQARFEKETQELQKKQQWYQENQNSISQEDQDTYLQYCSQAIFRIHILEARLNRHKEFAPHIYLALEDRLHKDPRLSPPPTGGPQ